MNKQLTRPQNHYDKVTSKHPELIDVLDKLSRYAPEQILDGSIENLKKYNEDPNDYDNSSYIIELQVLSGYLKCGQQVFCLNRTLQDLFIDTSLSGVPFSELHLPHEVFFVSTPDNEMTELLDEDIEFLGVYVADSHFILGEIIDNIYPTHHKLILGMTGVDRETGELFFDYITFNPDAEGDLEEKIKEWTNLKEGDENTVITSGPDTLNKYSIQSIKRILFSVKIFANLLVYLNSETPVFQKVDYSKKQKQILEELKKRPTKASLRRRLEKSSGATVTFVAPFIKEAEKVSQGGSHASPRWHKVRGHWRNVWKGPRNDPENRTQVRRWIKPFWRGESLVGKIEQRTYVID